jgi:hypothetical protein
VLQEDDAIRDVKAITTVVREEVDSFATTDGDVGGVYRGDDDGEHGRAAELVGLVDPRVTTIGGTVEFTFGGETKGDVLYKCTGRSLLNSPFH